MKTQQKLGRAPETRGPAAEKAIGRRRFLTGALTLTGGGATAVAVAADIGSEAAAADGIDNNSSSLTYRETEHIRQFYARCRF